MQVACQAARWCVPEQPALQPVQPLLEIFVNPTSVASDVLPHGHNAIGGPVLRVGLIGTGVVGSGTCAVLQRNADVIAAHAGRPIRVVMASARNLDKAAQVVGPDVHLVDDPMMVVNHPDMDVVVEVMGGVGLARDLVLQAIAQGKHVVTANKALLALHGAEIFEAADRQGVIVAYEAAVAVSIPIIKAVREGLSANRVQWIAGIVNGTTNDILTRMRDGGLDFSSALHKACELGYAEADPSLDVQGEDAAHKMALLAANAFGCQVPFEQVNVQGITDLQAWDFTCAQALGYSIKLLGLAQRCEAGLDVRVHPALLPKKHLLAQVDGAMNGVAVKSDAAGITFYYGAGAGSETTASAVIADLVDVARLQNAGPSAHVAHRGFRPQALTRPAMVPLDQVVSSHYLRVQTNGQPEALDAVVALCHDAQVVVREMREVACPPLKGLRGSCSVLLLTGPVSGGAISALVRAIERMAQVKSPVVSLRVEVLT